VWTREEKKKCPVVASRKYKGKRTFPHIVKRGKRIAKPGKFSREREKKRGPSLEWMLCLPGGSRGEKSFSPKKKKNRKKGNMVPTLLGRREIGEENNALLHLAAEKWPATPRLLCEGGREGRGGERTPPCVERVGGRCHIPFAHRKNWRKGREKKGRGRSFTSPKGGRKKEGESRPVRVKGMEKKKREKGGSDPFLYLVRE